MKSLKVLFVFIGFVLFGCSQKHDDRLIVGMELSYPPFEMTDPQGNPTGVSVDLAKALAQHLGKKIEIQNIPFDGLIPSLKTGKIDLIISSMTANEERAQSIDFSEPYVHTGLSLLVGRTSDIQSIADVDKPSHAVAVKKGTTGHTYAVNHLKQAKILVLDQESACVLEVLERKADVFMYDQISVLENWKRNPETTRALLDPFQKESWAIGIRKGNDQLKSRVNQFLEHFHSEKGFETLGGRYLKEQKETFRKLGYPFFF
jgi:polar amino acid transport system substrate-binding protein